MNGRPIWSKGIISAVAVMILTGGMVAGLFQQANAITITSEGVPTEAILANDDPFTITFTIDIPEGHHIPVENVQAVLETTNGAEKVSPGIVASVTCDTPIQGCPSTSSDALTSIEFTGEAGTEVGENGYGYASIDFENTGYGYFEGHGYGYAHASFEGSTSGYGYGYGYNQSADLTFQVTVDPSELETGHHWLTFVLDTGIGLTGFEEIHAPAEHFLVVSPPSTTPGGSGGGPSVGSPVDVDPSETLTFDGFQLPDLVNELTVTLDDECQGCEVNIDATTTPPAGAPPTPGVNAMVWFDIDVRRDGTSISDIVRDGTLSFDIPEGNLGDVDPDSVFLFRSADGWEPLRTEFVGESSGVYTFEAALPGFSTFAAASSDEAPELVDATPPGGSTIGPQAPVVEITLDDDAGIDLEATTLSIGEANDVDFDAAPLTTGGDHCKSGECTITYALGDVFPGGVPEGTYTVDLEAVDASGNAMAHAFEFTYESACQTPPSLLEHEPRDGEIFNVNNVVFSLHLAGAEGACALNLDSLQFRVNFEAIPHEDLIFDEERDLAGGLQALSVTYPDRLEDDAHTIDVRIQNQIGQQTAAAWVITTDTSAPQVTFIDDPDNELLEPQGVDVDLPIADRLTVTASTPTIVIGFEEPASGIDVEETTLRMDGELLPAEVTATQLTYAFEEALDDGEYAMELILVDQAGNQETHTWTMEVDTGLPAYLLFVIFLVAATIIAAVGYGVYKRRPPA